MMNAPWSGHFEEKIFLQEGEITKQPTRYLI